MLDLPRYIWNIWCNNFWDEWIFCYYLHRIFALAHYNPTTLHFRPNYFSESLIGDNPDINTEQQKTNWQAKIHGFQLGLLRWWQRVLFSLKHTKLTWSFLVLLKPHHIYHVTFTLWAHMLNMKLVLTNIETCIAQQNGWLCIPIEF
jgi:hypothetical protein